MLMTEAHRSSIWIELLSELWPVLLLGIFLRLVRDKGPGFGTEAWLWHGARAAATVAAIAGVASMSPGTGWLAGYVLALLWWSDCPHHKKPSTATAGPVTWDPKAARKGTRVMWSLLALWIGLVLGLPLLALITGSWPGR